MLKRPRPTIRFWIVAVAVVAILLEGWHEWHFRRLRTICARIEATARRYSDEQERERASCLEHQAKPYKKEKREVEHSTYGWPEYRNWLDEANQHAEWAKAWREIAQQVAERKLALERHLIFP